MGLQIETYYDITCSHCEAKRSELGKNLATNAKRLEAQAKNEGWADIGGETLCPTCAKSPRVTMGRCYTDCPHLAIVCENNSDWTAYCDKHVRQKIGSDKNVASGLCMCLFPCHVASNAD